MDRTAAEVIDRALRRIAVLNGVENAMAVDQQVALDALNAMMFAWPKRGITYTHVRLNAGDSPTIGDEYEEALTAMLAMRIADEFAPDAVTDKLALDAKNGWWLISAGHWTKATASFDLPQRTM